MRTQFFVLLAGAALLGTRAAAQTQLASFDGAAAGNFLGQSVAWIGDVNGDGYDDFAFGATGADFGLVSACGSVAIYSGKDHVLLNAVDGGGDINADGFADVVGGQYDNSGNGGVVRTYLGPAGTASQFHQGVGSDHLGSAVANVGDVDKDGYDDFAGGAIQPLGNGYFSIWSGKTGGLLYSTIAGQGLDDEFGGSALAGSGDANDDGWPDLLVGADFHNGPGGTQSGRAYLYDTVIHQTDLGFGGPGVAKLDAYGGPLSSGSVFDLWLTKAKPSAPAWLVASASKLPTPFKGGTLVPNIGAGFLLGLVVGPDGRLALTNLPGGSGPIDIDVQFVIKDAGQVHGFALSNAVKLHFLP